MIPPEEAVIKPDELVGSVCKVCTAKYEQEFVWGVFTGSDEISVILRSVDGRGRIDGILVLPWVKIDNISFPKDPDVFPWNCKQAE